MFYDRFIAICQEREISPSKAAVDAGLSKSTVSRWKKDPTITPSGSVLETLARYFSISVAELLGEKENPPAEGRGIEEVLAKAGILKMPQMKKLPLVGDIACGSPILAEEHIDGYVDCPDQIHADFTLRCKGDSMINARIYDGDIVYIRQQETVENGEIAAVLIDEEATLKRIRLYADHIVLEPANPMYQPIAYWGEEMKSVRIIGKAVAFTSCIL